MHSLKEISDILEQARREESLTYRQLAQTTGFTAVTLRGLFQARTDPRLTTLMAVADTLGLEVMLVPKAVSASLRKAEQPDIAEVPTLVGTALKRGDGK